MKIINPNWGIINNNLSIVYDVDFWHLSSILGNGYNSHKLKTTNTYI